VAARAEILDCSNSRTTKLSRLEENIGAVDIELTATDLRTIDEASSKIKAEGDRYPAELEKQLAGR
jgi:diketogulonate reductase-like aldo/keto reductase